MVKSFTIIGTGVTGTGVLIQLAQQFQALHAAHQLPKGITVTTIDKHSINGPGYPYNPLETEPFHLLNHPAIGMGLRAVDAHGKPVVTGFYSTEWKTYDFILWLERKRTWIITNEPEMIEVTHPGVDLSTWHPQPDAHYPRALFGMYLQDLFEEAVATLQQLGVKVRSFNDTELIAARRQNNRLILTLLHLPTGSKQDITTTKLLLSTGRWTQRPAETATSPFYFENSFPASRLLQKIKPTKLKHNHPKRIIVVGMGLSSLDVLLTLAQGEFVRNKEGVLQFQPIASHPKLIVVSRSGYFPVVRGLPKEQPKLHFVTEENLDRIRAANNGYLTIASLTPLLQKELRAHFGKNATLRQYFLPNITAEEKLRQDFMKAKEGNQLFALFRTLAAKRLTLQLTPEDRERFLNEYKTIWIQNMAPFPIVNAEKMLALLDAGVLEVVRLGKKKTTLETTAKGITLHYGDHQHITADYIVNATGDDIDLDKYPDPFLKSLFDAGEIVSNSQNFVTDHTRSTKATGIKVDERFAAFRQSASGKQLPSPFISVVGMLAADWNPEKNAASMSMEAAHIVANEWATSLTAKGAID